MQKFNFEPIQKPSNSWSAGLPCVPFWCSRRSAVRRFRGFSDKSFICRVVFVSLLCCSVNSCIQANQSTQKDFLEHSGDLEIYYHIHRAPESEKSRFASTHKTPVCVYFSALDLSEVQPDNRFARQFLSPEDLIARHMEYSRNRFLPMTGKAITRTKDDLHVTKMGEHRYVMFEDVLAELENAAAIEAEKAAAAPPVPTEKERVLNEARKDFRRLVYFGQGATGIALAVSVASGALIGGPALLATGYLLGAGFGIDTLGGIASKMKDSKAPLANPVTHVLAEVPAYMTQFLSELIYQSQAVGPRMKQQHEHPEQRKAWVAHSEALQLASSALDETYPEQLTNFLFTSGELNVANVISNAIARAKEKVAPGAGVPCPSVSELESIRSP